MSLMNVLGALESLTAWSSTHKAQPWYGKRSFILHLLEFEFNNTHSIGLSWKEHRPMEFIKHIFQPWYGTLIFDFDFVDGSAVCTHPHRSILLGHKKGSMTYGLKISRIKPLEMSSSTFL